MQPKSGLMWPEDRDPRHSVTSPITTRADALETKLIASVRPAQSPHERDRTR